MKKKRKNNIYTKNIYKENIIIIKEERGATRWVLLF
jgi:hypothetical protein